MVLQAWDRQRAFCGYDGQLAGACAGLEAAHVRWFPSTGQMRLILEARPGAALPAASPRVLAHPGSTHRTAVGRLTFAPTDEAAPRAEIK
jgi:hypothetical protein